MHVCRRPMRGVHRRSTNSRTALGSRLAVDEVDDNDNDDSNKHEDEGRVFDSLNLRSSWPLGCVSLGFTSVGSCDYSSRSSSSMTITDKWANLFNGGLRKVRGALSTKHREGFTLPRLLSFFFHSPRLVHICSSFLGGIRQADSWITSSSEGTFGVVDRYVRRGCDVQREDINRWDVYVRVGCDVQREDVNLWDVYVRGGCDVQRCRAYSVLRRTHFCRDHCNCDQIG